MGRFPHSHPLCAGSAVAAADGRWESPLRVTPPRPLSAELGAPRGQPGPRLAGGERPMPRSSPCRADLSRADAWEPHTHAGAALQTEKRLLQDEDWGGAPPSVWPGRRGGEALCSRQRGQAQRGQPAPQRAQGLAGGERSPWVISNQRWCNQVLSGCCEARGQETRAQAVVYAEQLVGPGGGGGSLALLWFTAGDLSCKTQSQKGPWCVSNTVPQKYLEL